MHLNWKKLSRKAGVFHAASESILASFHWSSVYAFLQCKIMTDVVQFALSSDFVLKTEKLIMKLLCHKCGGSSTYL